jgi:hypothetical protein
MIDALPTCAEFDYGQYEPKLADELRQAAERIRSRGQDQIAAIVDIGNELNQVKNKVGHGNWGSWLNSEFAMSIATANRYLRGAAFIADKRSRGKFVTVTNLTAGLLFQMSAKSAPPLLVHEAVERAETDAPMSEKEFRSRLAALKKAKSTATIGAATEAAQDQENAHSAPEHGCRPQTFGREQEAANAAVLMVRESLGDQFPTFAALVEEAGRAFSSALRGSAILPTTIPIASTTQVNLQPTAVSVDRQGRNEPAASEPSSLEPAQYGCSNPAAEPGELLHRVTRTGAATPEPQPGQGDEPEVHNVQEFRKPAAEVSVREPRVLLEDSPPKTMHERLATRRGGATLAPPGVICSHKQGICGYTSCLSRGRCLATPGSQAAAPLRPDGASSCFQPRM